MIDKKGTNYDYREELAVMAGRALHTLGLGVSHANIECLATLDTM